ncbi:MAG: carbon storage regulator [Marinobacterium sp.]|nr:carbon storage regulator [Marinobacterium sp.]
MLIVTVYLDEITTVSTPSGDVISFVVKYTEGRQAVVGIEAPEEYAILRARLRERVIDQINHYPVYIVSCRSRLRYAISARNEAQAISYYQQLQPDSHAIETELITNPTSEPWFEKLLNTWMRHSEPPVRVLLL